MVEDYHRSSTCVEVSGAGSDVKAVPDPSLAKVYGEALERHMALGKSLFSSKH